MFMNLLKRLFGGGASPPAPAPVAAPAPPPAAEHKPNKAVQTFLCRDAVLDHQLQVVGYQLMMHEGMRQRAHLSNRRTHHAYSQLLVNAIAQSGIALTLGRRKAFLDIPDSFLGNAALDTLPAEHVVLVLETLDDGEAPDNETLAAQLAERRNAGFKLAQLVDPRQALPAVIEQLDFIVVRGGQVDPEQLTALVHGLRQLSRPPRLILRDLPSSEDFQLGVRLGAVYFQGPFVTRRENLHGRKLASNAARLAQLLNRLGQDANPQELAALLKQDAALSLKLLRYINSAAVGLSEPVSSIERALMLMGREKLYRWALLLLYSGEGGSTRSAALLENALVRARMLELLGEKRPPSEREALYLTGLLSLTDLVLEVPMREALDGLSPAPAIRAALLDDEGWLADYLRLAIASESFDPQLIALTAEACGVTPLEASARHMEALAWAVEVSG